MSLPPTEKLLAKVKKFVRSPALLTLPHEIKPEMNVPSVWVEMLRRQDEGTKSWAEPWKPYRHLLSGVYDFLEHQVQGVCILLEDNHPPSLLYVYSSQEENYFHRGWPPLGNKEPDGRQDLWARLLSGLQQFYAEVHDGWTDLSSNSIGPLPVQDTKFLSDYDWDVESEALKQLPFHLEEVITVFSNGGGDYLGLDLGQGVSASEDHALAWWHEEPLESDIDQNFWALMDGWICGQMEDVDLARQQSTSITATRSISCRHATQPSRLSRL